MIINFGSSIRELLQALSGTWALSKEDEWTVLEQGNLKIFQKVGQKGKNVLPDKFIKNRDTVTPYLVFYSHGVTGGCITLQQQYVDLDANGVIFVISIRA